MDRHDMMCKYTLHIALEKKSEQVSPLCHGQECEERGSSWLLEMREITYYSQKHPISALNCFLIFPVYFVSSHVRERGWLALGFAVDQTVSWCWSAQLHPSPVKWAWLTPVDSLAPYHLSAGGCGICYPFGALVSVCLTLEIRSAIPIEFQCQDRHELTQKRFCWGPCWFLLSCIVLIFIALYSRLSSAAQQSDGAGGAQPVYKCQAGPAITYPAPKPWFCRMELSHCPFWVRALGCPRDELLPASSSLMSHAKDELLAHRSSIPQQPSWNSSPYFWVQLGNNYGAVVALAFGGAANNWVLNVEQLCRGVPESDYGEQASKQRCGKLEAKLVELCAGVGRREEKQQNSLLGFF